MKHYIAIVLLILAIIFTTIPLFDSIANTEDTIQKSVEQIYILKEESKRPWWLGDILTVLTILAGGFLLFWQMRKQHEIENKVQKENNRDKLRLEIYQEFSGVLDLANNKTVDVGSYVRFIPIHLKIYRDQVASKLNPSPVKDRVLIFQQQHEASSASYLNLIRLFEKYEIISPELDIFKMAVNDAMHDLRESFVKLHGYLLRILPIDIISPDGNKKLANVLTPNDSQIVQLEKYVEAYIDANGDMAGYLFDLNVELQNTFLKTLFDNIVKKREPLDPSVKVITTTPSEVEKLRKYFNDETDWGKIRKKTEDNFKNPEQVN
ncbi:MAG: hypothetical protein NDI81_13765 [Desulfobacula sp.]|nr:hypothetical protein [Desulfobacula sp.]